MTRIAITDEDIAKEADRLATEWAFPDDCDFTPDSLTVERARQLMYLLKVRMRELVSKNVNPIGMTIQDLLPGINPDELEV